jgi:hypothetical protein
MSMTGSTCGRTGSIGMRAYVGTATNGGYADLNYNVGVPGGTGTAAKYYAVAGTTAITDWAARTKSRYTGLQVAFNRPFRNGLFLKGAYTWSQARNMADEDGWITLTWNYLPKYNDNYALAGFDRTHMFNLGWLYELPFLKNARGAKGAVLGGWQINGVFAAFSGVPFNIAGAIRPSPTELQEHLAIGCQLQPVLGDRWPERVATRPLQPRRMTRRDPHARCLISWGA